MPTLIKLKRADTSAAINAVTLAKGEPAVDFDSGTLYIGDGSTSPGLVFASTESDASVHFIASGTGIGASHQIHSFYYGAVLKSTGTSTAKMDRLGFYELGPIVGLPGTAVKDFNDPANQGLPSRWHWMHREHCGPTRSVFCTIDDWTSVGEGSGSGVSNMAHSGTGTSIGHRVQSISYDVTSLTDTNKTYALVAKHDGVSNNTLQFKVLGAEDLTGGAPTHDMTSTSHSCAASRIFYSGNEDEMKSLSFSADTVAGKVIKRADATTLEWANVAYSDITGTFTYLAGSSENNDTLRFDSTQGSWVRNPYINSLDDLANALIGFEINNKGRAGRNIVHTLSCYKDGATLVNAANIFLPGTTQRATVHDGTTSYLSLNTGLVIDVTGVDATGVLANQILMYTTNRYQRNEAPNLFVTKYGNVRVNVGLNGINTLTGSSPLSVMYGVGIPNIDAVFIGSSSDTLPQFSAFYVGDITYTHNDSGVTNASNVVSGFRVGNISTIGGSADADKKQPITVISLGNTSSYHDSYFIKSGNITISAGDEFNKVAGGVVLGNIVNNSSVVNSSAYGLKLANVGSSFTSAGIYIDRCYGNQDVYGINIRRVDGAGSVYGMYLASTRHDAATSGDNMGLWINDISGGTRVAGISVTNVRSTNSPSKVVGLYINVNTSNYTLAQSDVAVDVKYAIYATGGRNYFGGATYLGSTLDVTGISTFRDNVLIQQDKTLDVTGPVTVNTDTAVNIWNGDIFIHKGLVREYIYQVDIGPTSQALVNYNSGSPVMYSFIPPTLVNDTQRQEFIQNIRTISINLSGVHEDVVGRGVHRIGPGFHGQIIHFVVKDNANANKLKFFDRRYRTWLNSPVTNGDIRFTGGDGFGVGNKARHLALETDRPLTFICLHQGGFISWTLMNNDGVQLFDT